MKTVVEYEEEFNAAIWDFKIRILDGVYERLTDKEKTKFINLFGYPREMREDKIATAFGMCKRSLCAKGEDDAKKTG